MVSKKEGRYSLYMVTVDCDKLLKNNPHCVDAIYISEDILEALKTVSKDIVGQLEKGKIEGKYHYQLAIRTNAQIRPSTLKKKIQGIVGPINTVRTGDHKDEFIPIDRWTFIPIQTSFDEAVKYCTKSDTRVGEKIVYGTLKWSMQAETDWLDDANHLYPLASVDPFFTLHTWDD